MLMGPVQAPAIAHPPCPEVPVTHKAAAPSGLDNNQLAATGLQWVARQSASSSVRRRVRVRLSVAWPDDAYLPAIAPNLSRFAPYGPDIARQAALISRDHWPKKGTSCCAWTDLRQRLDGLIPTHLPLVSDFPGANKHLFALPGCTNSLPAFTVQRRCSAQLQCIGILGLRPNVHKTSSQHQECAWRSNSPLPPPSPASAPAPLQPSASSRRHTHWIKSVKALSCRPKAVKRTP